MRRAATLFFAVFAATAAFAANEGKPMDDPYIWLEDIHGEKPLAWVKAENAKSLGHLKADPAYQKNYDFILNVLDAKDRIPYGGLDHGFVYNFWQDAEHPKGVWRRTTIADYAAPAPHWDILIDHDKLAADEKENWVWKGSECSPSQKHCLVHLSRGGGDAVVVREFDPAAKRFIMDGFTLTEAKSTATYIDDDHILFATDFGKGSLTDSGYPRIVKMFQRGVPIDRSMQVFEGEIKDVASQPVVFRDASGPIPIIVRAVDFFDSEYYYMHLDGGTVKLPIPLGADVKGVISGRLIFTLRKDWNFGDTGISKGTLVSYRLEPGIQKDPIDAVDVIYSPSAKSSVESVATGRDAVYVSVLNNVIGEVHAFRFQEGKWTDKKLPLPDGGSANIISTNDFGPEVYLSFESFLKPTTLYADNGGDTPKEIKSLPPRFDATGLETVQYEATSKDGTKIPYFVVRSKTLKGPVPTILYGYGGFEISETPYYSAGYGKLWVRQGGVFVIANIRGGGEFGPGWHEAALKTNRQKAFDDFAAVAADLVARKITTAKQLGIVGGSNGGLLVSTVMTQHPELLGAVVCQVPLIDMIRYTQIGAGASWIAEYGDPADTKMAAYIRTYSPYQNVSKDKKYPPVFFVTATSDDRVTPVHARKMAARMMEQGHEVLFYENTDGGHAAAANHKQAAEMSALTLVYLAEKLGLKGQ